MQFVIVLFVPAREGSMDLDQATRLEGTVVNVSRGGMCVRAKGDTPRSGLAPGV